MERIHTPVNIVSMSATTDGARAHALPGSHACKHSLWQRENYPGRLTPRDAPFYLIISKLLICFRILYIGTTINALGSETCRVVI